MRRLVLTGLALVLITCVVAEYDSHERDNRRDSRRNYNRDDRDHRVRGHGDRDDDDWGHRERGHRDWGHRDRDDDSSSHHDRDDDDRVHHNRRHDVRGNDDRRDDDNIHHGPPQGHGNRHHGRHGHRGFDDRHDDRRPQHPEDRSGEKDSSGEEDDSSEWNKLNESGEGETNTKPEEPIKLVKMASGDTYNITTVNVTGWTCGERATELVDLQLKDAEYSMVTNEMEKTKIDSTACQPDAGGCVKRYNIIKIQKIVNGCLWKRYRDKQQIMKLRDNVTNEMMLFHGTSAVDKIVSDGFDERYTTGGPLGSGLYFVTSSSVANQYVLPKTAVNKACTDCERRLLLSRVSLGKVYELDKAGDVDASGFGYAPMGYVSLMAKREGKPYNEYAVYRGDEAYPEYLITYKIITA